MAKDISLNLARDTIGDLVAALTRDYGALPQIIDTAGTATFADIDARSLKLAQSLLASGVTKGAKVGILMPNGQDFLVALFGATRIGAVAVLMSTLARPPELAHMIRHTDIDTLLTADCYLRNDYVAMLEEALPSLRGSSGAKRLALKEAPYLRAISVWGAQQPAWSSRHINQVNAEIVHAAQNEVVPSDPSVIIFSSGSSAEPKAVIHSHGAIVRQGQALCAWSGCEPGDRILSTLPFFWVGGLCTTIFSAICSGTAVLCPDDHSTAATIACMETHKATHMMQWPAQIEMMKDNPAFDAAMAKMRPAYSHQLYLFGLTTPELTPNSLGMTETLGPHSTYPLEPLPKERAGSYGTAVGGIERRILDPETGAEQPPGTPGILAMRGGAVLIGIYRKAHNEVFDAQGFYRTDDICKLTEDGYLYFIARANDMVKVSGANVSPVEVELAIRKTQGVKAACVVGLAGKDAMETLAAAVVLEDGARVSEADLRDRLKTQLSSYKVPRHFVFLKEDEMPMTATAKVYRPALKRLLAARI